MENEYMRILNSVLQYEKSQFIIVSTGLMAVLAILMFVAVKQFKKKLFLIKLSFLLLQQPCVSPLPDTLYSTIHAETIFAWIWTTTLPSPITESLPTTITRKTPFIITCIS